MTKLYFSESEIKYSAIQSLNNASDKINSAYRIMNSLNIPESFAYRAKLLEFTSNLRNYINEVNYTEEWLRDSYTKYKLLEDNIKNSINSIPRQSFKTRESIIRKNLS